MDAPPSALSTINQPGGLNRYNAVCHDARLRADLRGRHYAGFGSGPPYEDKVALMDVVLVLARYPVDLGQLAEGPIDVIEVWVCLEEPDALRARRWFRGRLRAPG